MALANFSTSPRETGSPELNQSRMRGLHVSPLTNADVAHAATLAVRTLADESRLAQLGATFLEAFYRASLQHRDTIAAKAVDELGQSVGYVLTSADVHAFRRHVQPRIVRPMAQALVHPRRIRLVPNIVRGLRDAEPEPYIPAELLLLYVEPQQMRRGAGRALLNWLEPSFKERGIERYRVAVRSRLGEAKAFYQAVGFVFEQELPVLGEPMTYFVRTL